MAEITGTDIGETINDLDGVTEQDDSISALGGDDDVFGLGGDDNIDGGSGDDNLRGGEGKDMLEGDFGFDVLQGGNGDDELEGGPGGDELIGGDGADTAIYAESGAGVTVNLAEGTAFGGEAAGDTLIGIEHLKGSGHADNLTGNELQNFLYGGGGADFLQGGLGDDGYVVFGGISTITEAANAGHDVVFAGFEESGSITMPQNVEQLLIIGVSDGVQVTATGTEANDVIEGNGAKLRLNGLAGDDRLTGGDDRDEIGGGAGKDKLDGGVGIDEMRGGTGDDTYFADTRSDKVIEKSGEGKDIVKATSGFTLSSHVENLVLLDTANINGAGNGIGNGIVGNTGSNLLSGLGGNDVLKGGDGIDTLRGGSGQDVLFGGADRDFFDFNSRGESKVGSSRDIIQDFKRGTDDIDLRGIDAKGGVSGDQSFKFIGRDSFNGVKGELHYKDLGTKCLVQGDVNGDGNADFEILVKVGALSSGDFLL